VTFSVALLLIGSVLLVMLPRRSAAVPLLLAAAYTSRQPVLELGPANLSILRVLVLVGMVRVLVRGERMAHGINAVDCLLFAWAALLVSFSAFHTTDAWTFRAGMVLGELGVYALCRVFVRDLDDVRWLFGVLVVALVPLAALMLFEKYGERNLFAVLGGLSEINMREGRVRAYGPFGHPTLAGTVGATCLAMAVGVWRSHRTRALFGLCAGAGIVLASTSTGPIMMLAFTVLGLSIWVVRGMLRLIWWGAAAAILTLSVVMNDPVYFLMARIDLAGGSTGWHRAQLIRSAIDHAGEWWAVGTDYTRHWMPTGIQANEIHSDLTNHFVQMGVWGGLPLLLAFVLALIAAFRAVGAALREQDDPAQAFLIWTLGAMLFGQVMNFWASSPFDQSVSFFYLVLAMAGAARAPVAQAARTAVPSSAAVIGGIGDERTGLLDSRVREQRRSPSGEPPLIAWPVEWRA
jgi:hypothetical protein